MHQMSSEMKQCIDNCDACHRVLEGTTQHCLEKGGDYAKSDLIRVLEDCAQICQTAVDFMLRESPRHRLTCGVCAEICDSAAWQCEQFHDDLEMRRTAQYCRRAAESCREMARGMAA